MNHNFIDVLFTIHAKEVLFSITDRKDPSGPAKGDDDMLINPVSFIFSIVDEILKKRAPDLYREEWNILIQACIKFRSIKRELPQNTSEY